MCIRDSFIPEQSELPARDSAFTSHANEVTVFRGVTWLEKRPDLLAEAPLTPAQSRELARLRATKPPAGLP